MEIEYGRGNKSENTNFIKPLNQKNIFFNADFLEKHMKEEHYLSAHSVNLFLRVNASYKAACNGHMCQDINQYNAKQVIEYVKSV